MQHWVIYNEQKCGAQNPGGWQIQEHGTSIHESSTSQWEKMERARMRKRAECQTHLDPKRTLVTNHSQDATDLMNEGRAPPPSCAVWKRTFLAHALWGIPSNLCCGIPQQSPFCRMSRGPFLLGDLLNDVLENNRLKGKRPLKYSLLYQPVSPAQTDQPLQASFK